MLVLIIKLLFFFDTLAIPGTQAADSDAPNHLVDCKFTTPEGSTTYDFNNLIDTASWPLNITTTRPTPPSTTTETLLISLCKKLPPPDDPSQSCPDGTLVCLLIYNQIGTDRRLEKIIPVGIGDQSSPTIQVNTTGNHKESLQLKIEGSKYNSIQQSVLLNLICSDEDRKASRPSTKPTTTIYDPIQGLLNITWPTPVACASSSPTHKDSPSVHNESSNPFRNFVVFVFLIFFAYLILGMWLNYNRYGLTGLDGLPHKTFWEELPRKLLDLVRSSSLFSSRRPSARADYTPL
ncbi:hypothetical protein PGTUg99_005607 [Puccinia graminis f. sp. tritici]|uniref:Autophagy-related protein 27 n=1 Tax=Puccinia graminis f. sp. tritici TaxID=56615 RepID=A0A5B0RPC3_PUCGR|nr:hypothetical protein PGTUg99_005607 [Puccinia graminis f. sp. tritici]